MFYDRNKSEAKLASLGMMELALNAPSKLSTADNKKGMPKLIELKPGAPTVKECLLLKLKDDVSLLHAMPLIQYMTAFDVTFLNLVVRKYVEKWDLNEIVFHNDAGVEMVNMSKVFEWLKTSSTFWDCLIDVAPLPTNEEADNPVDFFGSEFIELPDYSNAYDISEQGIYSRILRGDWVAGEQITLAQNMDKLDYSDYWKSPFLISVTSAKIWAGNQISNRSIDEIRHY